MTVSVRILATAAAMVLVLAAGDVADAKPKAAAPPNAANAELMKMTPEERAAKLAEKVGGWCIGTRAFLMGIVRGGPRPGSAYWSLECADGRSFAIELDRDGIGTVIDCPSYERASFGKKCFKKL